MSESGSIPNVAAPVEVASQAEETVIATSVAPTTTTSQSSLEPSQVPTISTEDDIEKMKAQVEQMEMEAAKLREKGEALAKATQEFGEQPADIDARSVFINNLGEEASPEDIQQHFAECGTINRVTLLLDKFSGLPRGYAFIEFAEPADVAKALTLNESVFHKRNIKVFPKRTNLPGMRGGRGGRGGRGAFRGRGAPTARRPYRGRGGSTYRGGYTEKSPATFAPY